MVISARWGRWSPCSSCQDPEALLGVVGVLAFGSIRRWHASSDAGRQIQGRPARRIRRVDAVDGEPIAARIVEEVLPPWRRMRGGPLCWSERLPK